MMTLDTLTGYTHIYLSFYYLSEKLSIGLFPRKNDKRKLHVRRDWVRVYWCVAPHSCSAVVAKLWFAD